jgi:hypothetical protein
MQIVKKYASGHATIRKNSFTIAYDNVDGTGPGKCDIRGYTLCGSRRHGQGFNFTKVTKSRDDGGFQVKNRVVGSPTNSGVYYIPSPASS